MCSSSGNVKGKGRGAVAVSLSGLGVLGLGLWFCVHWHLLAAHYHMGRLAEATTFEEAKPWLEALARDSQNPDACVLILEKIGGDRQELTYWFFSYISLRPPAPLLPLLRSFAERLDRDERLLSLWAHYLRWREGRNFVEMLERTSESFDKKVWGHFVGIYRGHPEQLEPRLYLSRARNLAYAWLLGFSLRPNLPLALLKDVKTPEEIMDALGETPIYAWLRDQRHYLRFQEDLGRFVVDRKSIGRADPSPLGERCPVPKTPLPRWEGPSAQLLIAQP